MARRAEQKQRRRRERIERDQQRSASKKRKRLFAVMAGSVVAAAAAVAVVIALSNSGDSNSSKVAGVNQVSSDLKGITQNGTILGDPEAKATITEFGDLQCPACKTFSDSAFPQIAKELLKTGKAKMQLRLLKFLGPDSKLAAEAALAAAEQNKFYNYSELFYLNQGAENSGYVTDEFLSDLASAIPGLNLSRWDRDRKAAKTSAQLATNERAAKEAAVESTPTIVIKGPKGSETIAGAVDYSQFLETFNRVSGSQ